MLSGSGDARATGLVVKLCCDLQTQPTRAIIMWLPVEKGISFCKQSLSDYGERQRPLHDLYEVHGRALLAAAHSCFGCCRRPWRRSREHKLNLASVVAFPLLRG